VKKLLFLMILLCFGGIAAESGPTQLVLNPRGVGAGQTGILKFFELDKTNYVGIKAPDTVAVNIEFTWFSAFPAATTPITMTSAGVLSTSTINLASSDFVSGQLSISNGGTGQSSKTPAFDALSPLTTQGDMIYYDGADNVRLAKGSGLQLLRMNAGATAPEWFTIASTDLSDTTNIARLNAANVFSHATGQSMTKLLLPGSTSGTLTVQSAATAGTNTITLPAGTTDFSATGGVSQVVKQTAAGGAFTVAQLAASDLSNGTTGSNSVVLATSPTLTTPNIGTPSTAVLTNATGLPLTTGVTGTLSDDNGGTGQSTYATGDTLYASAANTLSKLPIGSTNQILSVVGGVPVWTSGVNPNVEVNLTHNTATTFATYTVPTMTSVGGTIVYTVTCSNGVEVQSNSGTFKWQMTNKADVFTPDSSQTQSTIASAGTLTVSFSFTTDGATDAVSIKCTASSSLTPTTLKIVYNNADGSVGTIVIPAASVSYSSLTSAAQTTQYRKNRVINGDFKISQRNPTASGAATTDGGYTADRFVVNRGGSYGGTLTWTASSTVPGTSDFIAAGIPYRTFQNSFRLDTTQDTTLSNDGYCLLSTRIEGYDIADLINSTTNAGFTVSFWTRNSRAGTYCIFLKNASGDRTYVSAYTVTANTWKYVTVTCTASPGSTWLTTNGVGLSLGWTLCSGTDFDDGTNDAWVSSNEFCSTSQQNWADVASDFYITGIQLEPGTSATPFESRTFTQELALCQRYYEKSFDYATVPAQGARGYRVDNACADDNANVTGKVYYAVRKRSSSVTLTAYRSSIAGNNTSGRYTVYKSGVWTEASSTSLNADSEISFGVSAATAVTVHNIYPIAGDWTADCEL
jgi:hypothetical protein